MHFLPTHLNPHRHATSLMKQYMTVQHPNPHIICLEPDDSITSSRYTHSVLLHRILEIQFRPWLPRSVGIGIITPPSMLRPMRCQDIEGVAMQMKRVRSIIEIVDYDIDPCLITWCGWNVRDQLVLIPV